MILFPSIFFLMIIIKDKNNSKTNKVITKDINDKIQGINILINNCLTGLIGIVLIILIALLYMLFPMLRLHFQCLL